jgi:hypothetical protein
MRIGAKVEGGQEHENAMRALLTRIDFGTRNATRDAADELVSMVQDYLRTYTHPVTTHVTPSPPYIGPPAFVTGVLHDTVRAFDLRVEGRNRWTMTVAPDTDYDRIQELGGFSGKHHATYTPPRPYLTPMILRAAATGAIRDRYRFEWSVVLRG